MAAGTLTPAWQIAVLLSGWMAVAPSMAATADNGWLELEREDGGHYVIRWAADRMEGTAAERSLLHNITLSPRGLTSTLPEVERTPQGAVRLHPDCAEVESVKTTTNAARQVCLRVAYRLLQPEADRVTCVETFTLLGGQPIIEYRMRFENLGETDLYVGERSLPFIFARFGGPMTGRWVARWGRNWTDEDAMGEGRLAWKYKRCASVQARNGHGLAFSVLSPGKPIAHYWDFDRWSIPQYEPNQIGLSMVGEQRGGGSINESVQIPAGESESMGCFIMAFLPGMDAHGAMLHLFDQLQAGRPMQLPDDATTRFPRDASTRPAAPTVMSPVDGAGLTDLAVTYRWQRIAGCYDYEIEVADDPAFETSRLLAVETSDLYARHMPHELLPAGTWYWRIRARMFDEASTPGPWSATRRMQVNEDHEPAALTRTLDARHPLFVVRDNYITLEEIRDLVPRSLDDVVALELQTELDNGGVENPDTMGYCKNMQALGLHGFIPLGHVSLAEMEWAFQHCPNVLGVTAGERFYSYPRDPELRELARRAMLLARKYGRRVLWADMHKYSFLWFADDPVFGDRTNAPYFVPLHKATNPTIAPAIQSQVLGWWIAGLADHFGLQVDSWYWVSAGFRGLGDSGYLARAGELEAFPPTFYIQQWLLAAMQGATVLKNECDAPWTDEGEAVELWTRYYLPFFRAVRDHHFIPRREPARDAVKIAVRADLPPDWKDGYLHDFTPAEYGPFAPLYATLFGIEDTLKEWIPNDSRYHFVPLLPERVESVPDDLRVVPVGALQDPEVIRSTFDAAYPSRHEGDAFVSQVDGSIAIMTTEENRDIEQAYALPLDHALVRRVSGRIGPHAYIMAKEEPDVFWLQANTAYPERNTELRITCRERPTAAFVPSRRGTATWDAGPCVLTVILDHHDGAVEMRLR